MNGNLEPEERVMGDSLSAKRKAIAVCNQGVVQELYDVISKLGWDCYDDVTVEIGGTQVSGIDVGEEYNKKWQSPIGTRKYNKDAFIIIKNQDRRDLTKSQSNPNLVAHHHKPEVATIEVANQKIAIQQDEKAIRATIKKSDDKKGYDTYSK
tara:strand:- start:155 stop:610 length:456 start_codon:yes stop_codon:yes gene_type:complete